MRIDLRILDALPDAFLAVADGTIVWIGGGARELLHAGEEELVGHPLERQLAPGEWARLGRLRAHRAQGWDIPATCRLSFVRPGREAITADVRFGSAEVDGVELLVLCARDLTELARAEQLIGRLAGLPAADRLVDGPALLEASEPVFLAVGWKGAFTEILPAGSITRRVLGAPPGDPIGDYGRSLIDREVPFEATPILAEVVRTGQPIFLDELPTNVAGPASQALALTRSLMKAQLIRSAWCPVHVGGRLTHVVSATGRDLTEHDFVALQLFAAQLGAALRLGELREELVRRERLAAVGEMAAVLAHEVRNPLGAIVNAEGGLRRLVGESPAAVRYLDIVAEESERLARLVHDLLDFARPSPPKLRAVALGPLLDEIVEAAAKDPAFRDARPSAEVTIPAELPDAQADPLLLRGALVNMVVNAFQHVPAGGRVRIAAEACDGEVRVRIRNDGPPIPPEHAGRLFEPFFTTRAAGTGLGLAIVRRIVEEQHGRVRLDPPEGDVSFSVFLPAAPRAAPP